MYWDGKNRMWAVKKEVAVMAKTPHYAMFSQPYSISSKHDYQRLKQTFEEYLPYLLKTPEERVALPNDQPRQWAMLFYSAYIGPDSDTPGLRRLFIPKNPRTMIELADREVRTKLRVPVEQFFGRLTKLWGILSGVF